MSGNAGVFNLGGHVRGIGLGPGSPDAWSEYPSLCPIIRDALDSIMTPSAFKALHYQPDTFSKIYDLRWMRFEEIAIFKINPTGIDVTQTALQGFGVLRRDGSIVDTLQSETNRSAYRSVFDNSRIIIGRNHCVAAHNTRTGNTQDVDSLTNMAFAFAMHRENGDSPHMMLKGFYPYFSTHDDALGQHVFLFFHKELNRLVLVSAPLAERSHALNFILVHGELHTFDKVCARCGKTGGLLKCVCKMVRYCCRECQAEHWPSHKAECRVKRRRVGGGGDV